MELWWWIVLAVTSVGVSLALVTLVPDALRARDRRRSARRERVAQVGR